MKRPVRTALIIVIIVITAVVAGHYVWSHPAVWHELKTTKPIVLATLAALYVLFFAILAAILAAQLALLGKTIGKRENVLLSAYSTLINFFGPGQSGPGVRAIYLKQKHGLRIRDFIVATLIYYAFYAMISAGFLVTGAWPWPYVALAIIGAGGFSYAVIRWYTRRNADKQGGSPAFKLRPLLSVGVLTCLQLAVQAIIYGIELRSAGSHASIGQIISYTGAANFALFVSITPGAIGIREAFLAFSTGLHHINGSLIVAANIIDRAVYILFLGMLFIAVLSLHAKQYLGIRSAKKADILHS